MFTYFLNKLVTDLKISSKSNFFKKYLIKFDTCQKKKKKALQLQLNIFLQAQSFLGFLKCFDYANFFIVLKIFK
jgi:hypothetical protein